MIWGFVDYENIGSLKDIELAIYQRLFVFCGPKNPNINMGNAAINEFISIEIIKLNTNGSNNLDFHIAYYLGNFSQKAPKNVQFHIITKDNGFNGLVSHIKRSGRICQKITPEAAEKQSVKEKKPAKFSPCAELTVSRLRQLDAKKRPGKEQTLLNWIESQCRSVSKNINAKSVLGELVKASLINKENSVIKYNLNF